MTITELHEWYEAESGKKRHLLNLNDGELVTSHYVEWLERRLIMALEPERSLLIKAKMREAYKTGLSFYDPQLADDQKDRLFDEWKELKEKQK